MLKWSWYLVLKLALSGYSRYGSNEYGYSGFRIGFVKKTGTGFNEPKFDRILKKDAY